MRRRDGGFALPVAIVILVAVSIMAVSALRIALEDFQANRSSRLAGRALYAAEAGAQRTLVRWTSSSFGGLPPGDSASTGWVQLPSRAVYQSVVVRVDDGSGTPIFRVLTEGRPDRHSSARRRILTMLQASGGGTVCCDAAVAVRGRLTVQAPPEPGGGRGRGSGRGQGRGGGWTPPTQVDGRDHVPFSWATYCPNPGTAIGGVSIDDLGDLRLLGDPTIEGSPKTQEDRSIGGSLVTTLGTTTYDDLAARAEIVYDRHSTYLNGWIRPSGRHGVCTTSDDTNWGAPEDPGSACWDYLPVIHATGDLTVDASGQGQGILLVDGDLDVSGALSFYGLIVVQGSARFRGSAEVTGGVLIGGGNRGRGRSSIAEDALLSYGSCAIARSTAGLGGISYLNGRHWFEIS